MSGDTTDPKSIKSKLDTLASNAAGTASAVSQGASALAGEAAKAASGTALVVVEAASAAGAKVSKLAAGAVTLVGDLNGDGVVDEEDAKIARAYAAGAISVTADEAGKLAKSVARAPLTKDVATYAAVGAAISLPLPFVGAGIGAAVGAGLGLWRNLSRHETVVLSTSEGQAQSRDPLTDVERLHTMKERGIITDEEFAEQKRKILR